MWDLPDFGHINQGIEEQSGDIVIKRKQIIWGSLQLQIELFHNELEEKNPGYFFSVLTPCEHTDKPSKLSGLRKAEGDLSSLTQEGLN